MLDHGYKKLKTAYNAYEKGLFRAILEDAGFAYKIRSRGAGDYLRVIAGQSLYADDFYVREEDWELANQMLEGFVLTGDEEEAIVLPEDEEEANRLDWSEDEDP